VNDGGCWRLLSRYSYSHHSVSAIRSRLWHGSTSCICYASAYVPLFSIRLKVLPRLGSNTSYRVGQWVACMPMLPHYSYSHHSVSAIRSRPWHGALPDD